MKSAPAIAPASLAAESQPEPAGASHNLVQVIARAASIMRVLEGVPDGMSLAQIAARVGLARSTVQRIAGALQAEKLLISASPNGRIRLGPALLRLAASVQTDVLAMARPLITALSVELGETVDFASVRRDQLVFLDQIVGTQRLRAVSAIGETFPLTCTANGKAVLAEMNDAEIERLVGRTYVARTEHTLTTLDALLRQMVEIRAQGIAYDRQEHTPGICAAGVALFDNHGNSVAISVPVPSQRFPATEHAITRSLLRTKADLQALLAAHG